MTLGQASHVCLGQNAMAIAMLVAPVLHQPDLKDVWHESQQNTQARVIPGSPLAEKGIWSNESMFLGPMPSEPLK